MRPAGEHNHGMFEDLERLLEERSLPGAMRGYDRAATDALLERIEAGVASLLADRERMRAQLTDLEQEVAEKHEREQAISDALVAATRIRSDSERDAREAKAGSARATKVAAAEAETRAAGIVREAEVRAGRIVEEARLQASELEQELHGTARLAEQVRDRLTLFLESLLAQVQHPGSEFGSAVDELTARTGNGGVGTQPPATTGGPGAP
jgi:cell division septum initiation protein DivIVA